MTPFLTIFRTFPFGFLFGEDSVEEITRHHHRHRFFQNVLCAHENEKPVVTNYSGLSSDFERSIYVTD